MRNTAACCDEDRLITELTGRLSQLPSVRSTHFLDFCALLQPHASRNRTRYGIWNWPILWKLHYMIFDGIVAEPVPGHLASANLIGAQVTGTDPKVMAAVIRGALMNSLPAEALRQIDIPVLILNGKADAANLKIAALLKAIPTARAGECEGDHSSTAYEPTFHQAVVQFFKDQWRLRGCVPTSQN